jgi:probable HAF family extracellular repeat protein
MAKCHKADPTRSIGPNSIAFSINFKGNPIIVGEVNPSGFQEGERFDKASLLDPVENAANIFNIAYNSNDVGTIVGVSGLPSDPPNAHAVVFSSSPPFNLGNFGTDNSFAFDVNNDFNDVQHVVGTAATASGAVHAFFHTGTTTKLNQSTDDLGTLGGKKHQWRKARLPVPTDLTFARMRRV